MNLNMLARSVSLLALVSRGMSGKLQLPRPLVRYQDGNSMNDVWIEPRKPEKPLAAVAKEAAIADLRPSVSHRCSFMSGY